AEGPVQLCGPGDPLPGVDTEGLRLLLRAVFTAAGGTHEDWETYDRVMAQERRTAVLMTPERVYASARGAPARSRARACGRLRRPVPARAGRMAQVGSLMLLDTASLYFRAFYGVPETITAPDGTPVNAVRGLLDMITRLVRARHPARLVACLDADWRPAFRVAALPSYKAHRAGPDGVQEEVPPALAAQIPVIEQVLTAAGVAMAGAPGYEADDVIGTFTAHSPGPVEIVTGDRDLFQLVDDAKPARVIYTARGLTRLDIVDEAAITARYQIPGRAYADYATLRGDPGDGLPGVAGVGDKTAAALGR